MTRYGAPVVSSTRNVVRVVPAPAPVVYSAYPAAYPPAYPAYPAYGYGYPYYRPYFPVGVSLGFVFGGHGGHRHR